MTKVIHPVAGLLATLTIATFWLSTALSELFALHTVVTAKTTIPLGFLLLIPALAAAGGRALQRAGGPGWSVRKSSPCQLLPPTAQTRRVHQNRGA
jgi:hypothetical protein